MGVGARTVLGGYIRSRCIWRFLLESSIPIFSIPSFSSNPLNLNRSYQLFNSLCASYRPKKIIAIAIAIRIVFFAKIKKFSHIPPLMIILSASNQLGHSYNQETSPKPRTASNPTTQPTRSKQTAPRRPEPFHCLDPYSTQPCTGSSHGAKSATVAAPPPPPSKHAP